MPEIRHLSRAPIIEALVNFQANAAPLWKPEKVRHALAAVWMEHADIQELRPFEIRLTPDGPLPPDANPQVQCLVFRSKTQPSVVHQARRDGYSFSRLAPYQNWRSIEDAALVGWSEYQAILKPQELHAVAVRFINRLEFPTEGFKLSRYFTTPPVPPPGLDWQFHGFSHETLYAVPGSPCMVKATIVPAFVGMPSGFYPFVLDVEVTLKESLSALGKSVRTVLEEMHDLKNKAFFHLLTEEAIQLYQ
jgi:uncharacterized protein (TIGR04255 family)